MFRSRLFRALATLAGLGAIMYIMVSLFLPSSRRLVFGVDKRTGKVRLVQNHVTFLPPHQFYRLEFDRRQGAAQRDGFVRILSQEKVPVTISYRLRFSIPGERFPDATRLVRDGWSAWIRARVSEAVQAVAQQVPIEELLSPTSQFAARRDVLRQVVSRHLARSGIQVTAFEIARIEPDRRALLEVKRQELRREARGVAGRVAIFGLDGADWSLLSELSNDGRIPNIRALIQGGTTASLQTIQPTDRLVGAARTCAMGDLRGVRPPGDGGELVDRLASAPRQRSHVRLSGGAPAERRVSVAARLARRTARRARPDDSVSSSQAIPEHHR